MCTTLILLLLLLLFFVRDSPNLKMTDLVLNSDGEKDMIVTKYVPDNIEGLCAGDGVIGANGKKCVELKDLS